MATRGVMSPTVAADASIVVREPLPSWKKPDWQKLWLGTQRFEWNSLAIVPAGDMPAGFTLEIAVSLAQTGAMHLGVPIRVADATNVPLAQLKQFVRELEVVRTAGDRIVLALGTVSSSATTVTLAHSVDKALLCVPLEVSRVRDAKRTLAEIGAKHFIGSAVFHV